nr:hypothetical protein [Tanacetum cinerariifolium]
EGIPEHVCDVPSHDNYPPLDVSKDQIEDFFESNEAFSSIDDDSFSIDNIDYVEASPPDSEFVSSEVMEIVIPEISSGSPTTHSDSFHYASFIFDLSINPFPPVDRSDFYEFTDELIPFISPLEYDCFLFKVEPNSGDFTKDVVEDISPTKEPQVLNAFPTHPILQLNMKFQPSSEYLFTYVVWIFLPFLVYSVAPYYLLSLRTEDAIFDPGIFNSTFSRPDISHRCVKENQKKEKIGSKPDKNGKRGEAEKSQKQLQWIKQEKLKKTQKEGPEMQIIKSFIKERRKKWLELQFTESSIKGSRRDLPRNTTLDRVKVLGSDDGVTTSFQQSQDSRPHAQIIKDTFKMKAQEHRGGVGSRDGSGWVEMMRRMVVVGGDDNGGYVVMVCHRDEGDKGSDKVVIWWRPGGSDGCCDEDGGGFGVGRGGVIDLVDRIGLCLIYQKSAKNQTISTQEWKSEEKPNQKAVFSRIILH